MENTTKNKAVWLLAIIALACSATAIRYAVVSERPALSADAEMSKEASLAEAVAESSHVQNPFGDPVLVDDDSAADATDETTPTDEEDASVDEGDEVLDTGADDEAAAPDAAADE